MKVWSDYGSEHSANLVMIGRFKSVESAEETKRILDQIEKQVSEAVQSGDIVIGENTGRFSDGMMELLSKVNAQSVGAIELEQFAYDVRVDLKGSEIHITTDEIDVSAFLKVLVDKGARVEVYSAHSYPEQPEKK